MKDSEYEAWNLLDADEIHAAGEHVQRQLDVAEEDLALVRDADDALERIQYLLERMRALAQQSAQDTEMDRAALEEKFCVLRQRVDRLAQRFMADFSSGDAERLQQLLQALGVPPQP